MAMTTTAVRYHETGGPEVLRVEEVEVPEPGPGQALVRHAAIGVNYRDIYHRIGDIPAELPAVIGSEGAGVIEAVGPDTQDFKPGDRVSHCAILGSYAERMVIDARRLVAIPDGVSHEQAGASTLRGLTAHYLINSTYAVQPDDTILVHAAAGGMGLLLCQWAKHIGATVIGTVWQRREGRARPGARLRPSDRVRARGLRHPGQGDHGRPGRAGRLRRRWPGDLR